MLLLTFSPRALLILAVFVTATTSQESNELPGDVSHGGNQAKTTADQDDLCWPKEEYILLQPKSGCPASTGFSTGYSVKQTLSGSSLPNESDAPVNGWTSDELEKHRLALNYCKREPLDDAACSEKTRFTVNFQPGSYCVYQSEPDRCPSGFSSSSISQGIPCPMDLQKVSDFEVGYVSVTVDSVPTYLTNPWESPTNFSCLETPFTKHLGEPQRRTTCAYGMLGRRCSPNRIITTSKEGFCCRNDGKPTTSITLPTSKPFFLFPTSKDKVCQQVIGMQSRMGKIVLAANESIMRGEGVYGVFENETRFGGGNQEALPRIFVPAPPVIPTVPGIPRIPIIHGRIQRGVESMPNIGMPGFGGFGLPLGMGFGGYGYPQGNVAGQISGSRASRVQPHMPELFKYGTSTNLYVCYYFRQ